MRRRNRSIKIGRKGAERSLELANLRFKGTFTKDEESEPNRSTVEFYNLSPDTVALTKQKDCYLMIEAGYDDDMSTVFVGDVVFSTTYVEGPHNVTKLDVMDGFINWRDRRVSVSYPPGTTKQAVAEDAARSLGLPVSPFPTIPGAYESGFSFVGHSRDLMNMCYGRKGWSIQDGRVIVDKTRARVFILNEDTGMIGSPQESLTETKEKKQVHRIEVSCLLNAAILLGDLVKVQSRFFTGQGRVVSITHNMQDDEWATSLTLENR